MTSPWVRRIGRTVLLACASGESLATAAQDTELTLETPEEWKQWIGEGVGLDRLVTLTRDLSATSEFFTNELGFHVIPGQVFDDGFAVNYIYFHRRPLFEIQSIYNKQLAQEKWGDVEVRFLEKHQGGFQVGIGVSDIPEARRRVRQLNLPEQGSLGSPAQTGFEGTQAPYENKSAVLLAQDQREPYQYVAPLYFTNYTDVARKDGRERRPEDIHPALRHTHPNTATQIMAVYMAVDDLDKALSAYRSLGFTRAALGEHEQWGARMARLPALSADLLLLEATQPDGIVGNFLRGRGQAVAAMGVRIGVQDLALAQSVIEHNTGRSMTRYEIRNRPGFFVPPELTSDVFVEFVQE